MNWKRIDQLNLKGKRVLTRVDINVPIKDSIVSDTTRIERIIPTINSIVANGGIPIIISHFGRPTKQKEKEYSLKQLVPYLSKYLEQEVIFTDQDEINTIVKQSKALKPGQILLLENIRFRSGETSNDPILARQLAELGEVFCNDAFSAAHRAHASTEGIAHLLPNCVGFQMEAELLNLEQTLVKPKQPVTAIIGGSKISTKIDLLNNLAQKFNFLVIGGGMANTFLKAAGFNIGNSLYEEDYLNSAIKISKIAEQSNCKIVLPNDIVVAKELIENSSSEIYDVTKCPEDQMILDIGPKTIKNICYIIKDSKTLIWNGPLGAFEFQPFNTSTDEIAKFSSKLTREGKLVSVAGGGDTISALSLTGSDKEFTYISTAGGAFLEWMEGKDLPAIKPLLD
ncbi:MAG: phosphoglycerate kinase [Paracoccaceae bacterium]|jgi:phosphoglycerate kinase|nr:phosphoglycerate kinase [Paracoccaceae bacterium]